MANVNHRYSSPHWSLDLTAQRSPLSRWTGRDALRQEQLRLSLLGAEAGAAPVTWLAGDRDCLQALHQTIESYVQQGLSQPLLGPQSRFLAGVEAAGRGAAVQAIAPGVAALAPTDAAVAVSADGVAAATDRATASPFALEALGLLRHRLSYQPPDTQPRQLQLSTLQLADLLAVLDQWQSETLALPDQAPSQGIRRRASSSAKGRAGQDFVVPAWGRIAASLVIATGAVGSGVYVINQQLSRESLNQIALESEAENNPEAEPGFGQFPLGAGPPLSSQSSDPNFSDPFLQGSPPAEDLPPEADGLPPTVVFPGSPGAGLPGGPIAIDPQTGAPGTTTAANGGLGQAGSAAPGSNPAASGNARGTTTPGAIASGTAPAAAAGSDIAQANSSAAEDQALINPSAPAAAREREAAIASSEAAKLEPAEPQPVAEAGEGLVASAPSAASSSRGGQAAAPPAPAAAAPPAQQVTVARPLPPNGQSQAVQRYLEQNWTPPQAVQQPLQYRLKVSPEGKLTTLEPLSPTAQLYRRDANFPNLGESLGDGAGGQSSTLVVTLNPDGTVKVVVEQRN